MRVDTNPDNQICTLDDVLRWKRKARQCFTFKNDFHGCDHEEQNKRMYDLARDVFRTLDPKGFKKANQ